MLKRHAFDTTLFYRVVIYLRMSTDLQNRRSPQQQRDEIERRLKTLGYNWVIVKVFCDEAVSGKFQRKRHEYQQMLREIRSGTLDVDLILVDTLERFGRMEELPTIRKNLFERHGVLILTADTNFADPNSPAGKALGMVEAMRATEHGRILGHNVLRGKRDAAKLKHWPGGKAPFGLALKSIMKTVNGRDEVDFKMLVHNPITSWIMKLLFDTAAKTGWGTPRLARFLNAREDISDDYKPFHPSTIGYWLDNEIYYGEFVFEKHSTGIVDDMRVVELNCLDDRLYVPEFCEPLIDRKLWDEVNRLRQPRRDRAKEALARRNSASSKQILPPAPGMTVKYLLSGLIYCDECGLRMTASSSPKYTTKSGEVRRYASYICPGYKAGSCTNDIHIPEELLRNIVLDKIRERFFR